jgi:hypothetical protein
MNLRDKIDDEPRYVALPPWAYRGLISAQYEDGQLDRWEAWRLLFNAGLRGAALARAVGIR